MGWILMALAGAALIVVGGGLTFFAATFGKAGLFDRHQPDRAGVATGLVIGAIGLALVVWAAAH